MRTSRPTWSSRGVANSAAAVARLRTSGAASSQPTQAGANHAALASSATMPSRPRVASPAASSASPATTSAAARSHDCPAYVVNSEAGTRNTVSSAIVAAATPMLTRARVT